MSSAVTSEMQIRREDLNPCTVKLDIVCTPEQVKAGFDKAVRELSKKVNVPGFRKGMAPKKMVEDMLNPQALYETAADHVVRKAYQEALERESLTPDSTPSVDISKFYRGGEPTEDGKVAEATMEFSLKVPLKAIVELADTKGLQAERPPITVTDEEVEAQIEELRRRSGKKAEVTDRGIQDGDAAVVNLKSDKDETDERTFMLVAGQTFPELDAVLKGMTVEEVKSATLNFPETFQHEAWKGKSLKVRITVRSISTNKMPELDDAFAQSFSIESVDSMKEQIREGIKQAKEEMAKEMLRDQLLDDLISKSKVHVADTTWESVVARRLNDFGTELQNRNLTPEDYFKSSGLTEDEFRANLEKEAKVNVERAVVIQKIFQDNGMKIEAADIDAQFRRILAENNVPQDKVDQFAQQYGAQIREEIMFRVMASKVADLLIESAQITEASGEKAPKAPKPKAKATSKSGKK
ncbi:trigger factor [Kamptonema cortianum]|nr:trigger factor [Geitlerinema splendidum]MDK3156218.1 trigger factor [Kamptonema cortianum]